jgi:hypothetical protein
MMRTPGFLGFDLDALDLVDTILDLRVQFQRAFHRGLGMELGREGNLEQDVFHHVAFQLTLQHQFLAIEQHILEAPALGRQADG